MQVVSLLAVSLINLLPTPAGLTGIWALDRVRSDADAPRQFIARLEQTTNHLSITTLTVDSNGKRLGHQDCLVEGQSLQCLNPANVDEEWQITTSGELTIVRVITTGTHVIRQRLVLVRSTTLE